MNTNERIAGLRKNLLRMAFDRSVISWAAMAVSLTSFYLTVLDPPQIKILPGQSFQLWHSDAAELQIDYPLNFTNDGAQTGTIVSLALILEAEWLEQALLCKWGGTKVYDNGWRFASRERPISVLPKTSVDEVTNFSCGEVSADLVPQPGELKLTFAAWTGNSERTAAVATTRVELDRKDQKGVKLRLLQGALGRVLGARQPLVGLVALAGAGRVEDAA